MAKKYWLIKSEPSSYSIDDLEQDKTTLWDGVRNYQARNFMMKEMSIGDQILFYHSNTKPTCIVGLAKVSKAAQPDPTAFDSKSKYYDSKSTKEKPIWHCVEVKFVKKIAKPILLETIKKQKGLENMLLIKKGMRLSIQPVTEDEFKLVCALK